MSRTLNKVSLIGRLGKDPEMRYTASGAAVTTFTLATNRMTKSADGTAQEETDWHTIVTWDKLAETCNQYLTKGRQVYIEGRLQTRTWEQDGQKRYKTEIKASNVVMLGRREDGMRSGSGPAREVAETPEPATAGGGGYDDDVPF